MITKHKEVKKMSDNNTLDYYNLHTADFVNTTQNVDFHEIQELFLSFLPAKAKYWILDAALEEILSIL